MAVAKRSDMWRWGRWPFLFGVLLGVVIGAAVAWRQWGGARGPVPPAVPATATDQQVATAVTAARAAVTRQPRSAAAWGQYGMVLAAHGFAAEALPCFAEAERLQPEELRWPYYAGNVLLRSDPEAAVAHLKRALALAEPDDPVPRLRLAEGLLAQGGLDEAEGLFRQILAGDPANPRAHLGLAEIAHERGRADECQAHLRYCVDSPLARKTARALLAQVCEARHEAAAAAREARAAADLPDDAAWPDPYGQEMNDLRVGLGVMVERAQRLYQQGKPGAALALLDQAVRQYPDSEYAWVHYAKTLLEVGDLSAAEPAFRRAVALAPRMAEARLGLGTVLFARKDFAGAAEAFARAAESEPGDARAPYNRGLCLRQQGRRAEAIDAFRAAVRCQPDAARPRLVLAELLAEEGHTDEAESQVRQALAVDPDDAGARRLLEDLRLKSPRRRP